jgi:hypothetical protein
MTAKLLAGALFLLTASIVDPPGTRRPASPAALTPASPAPVEASGGNRQRGVALGLFSEDVSFSYAPLLAEIVALGATHVALIVPLYQTNGASDDVHLHTRFSPTLEVVADTIRAAARDRLEISLFPIVRLSSPRPGEWRGTLAPANPERWFRRYGDVLGDLAAVAAVTGAQRLVIGSELSSLDGDVTRWQPLVEKIRGVFKGSLVYSANWDHYREARLSIWSTKRASPAISTCAPRPTPGPTRRRWRRPGVASRANWAPGGRRGDRCRSFSPSLVIVRAPGPRRRRGMKPRGGRSTPMNSDAGSPPSGASGRARRFSTESTSGTGTATAGRAARAIPRAANRPRARSRRC